MILGWVGSIQDILHAVIRQTMLLTTLPRAYALAVFAVSLPFVATAVFQAILTKEMNTRLGNISISTSLALRRDKRLCLKC